MNQTATHQATYSTKTEGDQTIYFRNEAEMVQGLDDWFSITGKDLLKDEYSRLDGLKVTWGEVADLIFVCRCNLHECHQATKKNGGFRPGHDAKLVSWLVGDVRAGNMTTARAHAMLADRPALQAKLVKYLGG